MSKEQIYEMAKDFCLEKQNCNNVCNPTDSCSALKYATRAYEADYRKQSEGVIVIPPMTDEDIKHLRNILKKSRPQIIVDDIPDAWISVDERLPDRDGRYLVAMKNGNDYHISTRKFRRADPPTWWKGHTFGYWARCTVGVRYWMPLPEAPKMKGGAK